MINEMAVVTPRGMNAAMEQVDAYRAFVRGEYAEGKADRVTNKIPRAALRYGIPPANFRGLLCKEGWQ